MMVRRRGLALGGLAGIAGIVAVALPSVLGAQTTAARQCADPAHREFDFWIGSWVIEQTIH